MGPMVLGIISTLLFLGVTLFLLRKLRRFILIKKITPSITLLLFYFAYLIFRLFHPFSVATKVSQYIEALILFLGIFTVILVIEIIVYEYLLPFRKKTPPPSLLRDMIRWLLAVIILFALLKNVLNINLGPILFTSAAVTIVVGLALQDLLGNLFAGITLNMSRPFKIGDWVMVGTKEGEVINMTWRETGIITRDGNHVIIPNSMISKEILVNFTDPSKVNARHIKVGVSYDAPPSRVKDVMAKAALKSKGMLAQPVPDVRLWDFGDFSITYDLKFWIDDYKNVDQIENEIRTRIWYAFKRNNIHIPFPIRNVYMRTVPPEEDVKTRERDVANMVAAMRPVPILEPLNDEELLTLAKRVQSKYFGRGEVLVRQGEEGDSFFIIRSGRVSVSVKDARGEQLVIAHLDKGDFFGEGSLLTGEPRTATITTTEDTKAILIDKASFSDILKQNPGIAESLSMILADRLKELEEKKAESEEAEKHEDVESFKVVLRKIRNFFGL